MISADEKSTFQTKYVKYIKRERRGRNKLSHFSDDVCHSLLQTSHALWIHKISEMKLQCFVAD